MDTERESEIHTGTQRRNNTYTLESHVKNGMVHGKSICTEIKGVPEISQIQTGECDRMLHMCNPRCIERKAKTGNYRY